MYLQITQAAKRLGVSRQWIHELINRGAIGTSEVAGRRFVLDDDRFKLLIRDRRKAKVGA
jgi:excisionase family DNA binding protein